MQYILFEDESRFDLQPLTFTRPVSGLRIGIDTIFEKWTRFLGQEPGNSAWGYLGKWFNKYDPSRSALMINARFLPDSKLVHDLRNGLGQDELFVNEENEIVAAHFSPERLSKFQGIFSLQEDYVVHSLIEGMKALPIDTSKHTVIRQLPDLFKLNGQVLRDDIAWMFSNRKSGRIDDRFSSVYAEDNIFVEPGVKVRAAIINAEDGPIYLGENVSVQEGVIIHGAHAICANSTVNMGAKLRGDTTIGPQAKVGGEVANSVIWGYSNKGHDGYLGNSVIGQWCNIGADSNTSNLKNNYTSVRLWNYREERFRDTESQFCGLIMGDHSKCGINTMFNTGTVVGVSANIFGSGFPRNFIPSFSWGGASGFTTFKLKKMEEVAKIVMARRKVDFSEMDHEILGNVYENSSSYRRWEKSE